MERRFAVQRQSVRVPAALRRNRDLPELFLDEAAEQAAREDGEIGPTEKLPNPFYIRNPDSAVLRFVVPDHFTATRLDTSANPKNVLSSAEFAQQYCPGGDLDPEEHADPLMALSVNADLAENRALKVVEVYLP